jgi:two-component system response regulator NreC
VIRVLLANDQHVVREGLRINLEQAGFDIVAEASDRESAVRLARIHEPDVVVLDLASSASLIECTRGILLTHPTIGIIVLAAHAEEEVVTAALHAGVRGYVVKTQAAADLVHAIREVQVGGVYLAAQASRVVAKVYVDGVSALGPLTPRLREVLRLIADGKNTKEIAAALGVSEKTAELYRSRLMAKLDIHDTAGLVRHALRSGLLKP